MVIVIVIKINVKLAFEWKKICVKNEHTNKNLKQKKILRI